MEKIKEIKEKKVLHNDEPAFYHAHAMYSEKKQIQTNVQTLVLDVIGLKMGLSEIEMNTFEATLYKNVEDHFKKENTLNLKGQKLLFLKEIDITEILKELSKLKNYNGINGIEPLENDFKQFIETKEEQERYDFANKIISTITEYQDRMKRKGDLYGWAAGYSGVIEWNNGTESFQPRWQFVKNKD